MTARKRVSKEAASEVQELHKAAKRVFTTADGEKVLKKLRALTIENIASEAQISERALCHREGQRYIVAQIERWIRNGHEA